MCAINFFMDSKAKFKSLICYLSFFCALFATFGSLYFGEVLKLPPCTLCWYQRICMYPLVFIFGAAVWTDDRNYLKYSALLSGLGFFIASYHLLLYYGVIPENISPCVQGISCTARLVEYLGFITIPLMSWFSFLCINVLNLAAWSLKEKNNEIK